MLGVNKDCIYHIHKNLRPREAHQLAENPHIRHPMGI